MSLIKIDKKETEGKVSIVIDIDKITAAEKVLLGSLFVLLVLGLFF